MLTVYNTLTGQKDVFKPLVSGQVSFYVCGPTVYDYIHLGNARSFTAFDMMARYFLFSGYNINYVRNITDIDDKIIQRALEKKQSFTEITAFFTEAFQADMQALGLLTPTHEPRATEFLAPIIALIEKLIVADKAYIASNGDVYYAVRQFPNYGCLSHRNIDELESGARVDISDVKKDPLDFVLWKMAKPNEPSWPSPWGEGRPGWHIECSAMSMQLLGETFDIHGGGRDLTFPHHENEIAQTEGVTQKPFVHYWLHAGYLQMASEKMSKSLGNFFTVRDLLKEHQPEVLRFFLLSSQYRSSLSYSPDALISAHRALVRLYTALRDFNELEKNHLNKQTILNKEQLLNHYPDNLFVSKFIAAMDDDFNTPVAFAILFDLAHTIQKLRATDHAAAVQHATLLRLLGGVLGLLQADPVDFMQKGSLVAESHEIDSAHIQALIEQRLAARREKNWAEADRIRDELQALSIVLEDTATGTTWRRE